MCLPVRVNVFIVCMAKSHDCLGKPPSMWGCSSLEVCWISCDLSSEWKRFVMWSVRIMFLNACGLSGV